MNVIIIEDEALAAKRLQSLLYKIRKNVVVQAVLDSVEGSVCWLQDYPGPDLIFLDIQLGDGLSFNIFETVQPASPIIFTTAYDEYAMRAFQLNSIDYLLKPVHEEELERSLQKVETFRELFTPENIEKQLHQFFQNYPAPEKFKTRFLVNKADVLIPITTDHIAYFYAEDKLVFLKTKNNERYILNQTLEQLEKELNPNQFYRINRQYIISIHSIRKIHNYFNYKLKVEMVPETAEDVIVSRAKVSEFKAWLNQ